MLQPLVVQRKPSTTSLSTTTGLSSSHHSAPDAALKVLSTKSGVFRGGTTVEKQMVKEANIRNILFPWMKLYKVWWTITIVGAILTVFFGPYQIAFQREPGTFNGAADMVELILNMIFTMDIVVNFNLAFYKNQVVVFDRNEIRKEYMKRMFWVDLVGVFPFETLVLWVSRDLGTNSQAALLWSLLRLLRFVRLHRMKRLSDILQYDARISLLWFTLIRNCAAVLFTTHLAACSMYFIARLYGFGENTWLGPLVNDMNGLERYVASLYWSIVTFCTVGK
jgi:hypothetical protein